MSCNAMDDQIGADHARRFERHEWVLDVLRGGSVFGVDERVCFLNQRTVPWRPCVPSQEHRFAANIIIDPRFQAAPCHEVYFATQYLFEERLEAHKCEPTRSRGCFDQKVDVRVESGLASGDGSEDGQLGIALFSSQSLENRPSGIKQGLGMNFVGFGGELQLLTHCRLADPERFGDLVLAHPGGKHGPQRDYTPKTRGRFIAPSLLILRQQSHKAILSRPGNGFCRHLFAVVFATEPWQQSTQQ